MAECYHVVIIGAGVAGLSAAKHLVESGQHATSSRFSLPHVIDLTSVVIPLSQPVRTSLGSHCKSLFWRAEIVWSVAPLHSSAEHKEL